MPEDSLAEYRGLWPDPPYRGGNGYLPHPSPRAAYAAMITRMDREVGRILDLVRELGLDERTIVVFTSDNGPTYERIGRVGLGVLPLRRSSPRAARARSTRAACACPAIVRWNGRVPAGLVSERVTGFEDWLPTLLELAGAAEADAAGDRRHAASPRRCWAGRRSRGPSSTGSSRATAGSSPSAWATGRACARASGSRGRSDSSSTT